MHRRAAIRSVSAAWVSQEAEAKTLEIAVTFHTTAKITELDLGIQVNDAAGTIVWGTSTTRESLELDYESGNDSRAALIVECELPEGLYYVTIALSEPRRLGFHEHWMDRAATFIVAGPRRRGRLTCAGCARGNSGAP